MKRTRVIATLSLCLPASLADADGSADFDELVEGFQGHTVRSGGITFFNAREFSFDPPTLFVAEDASGYMATRPDLLPYYSEPNVFQLSGYITGGSYLITRFAEFSFTTGQVETSAALDLFYLPSADEFLNVEVALEALRGGQTVATDSFVITETSREILAASLSISGVEFDTLRLNPKGGDIPPLAGILGSIDNLVISGGSASPLALDLPSPGLVGQENTLTAQGATPGNSVYFAYGLSQGLGSIPGCPGVGTELGNPVVIGSAVADANGEASLSTTVPALAAGRTVYLQAVEPASCTVSNFVPFTFAPQ